MTEEREKYRKALIWACASDSDTIANRIVELENKAEAWDKHCEIMGELQEYVGCVLTPGYMMIAEEKRRKTIAQLEERIKELEEWKPSCYETCEGKYPQVSSYKGEPLTFYDGCLKCRFVPKEAFEGVEAVIERDQENE
jgi:hypothetical protein